MKLSGTVLPSLSDPRDINHWAVTFIDEFNEIQSVWQNSIADNVITSDEATKIEKEMRDILGALTCLFVSLHPGGVNLKLKDMQFYYKGGQWQLSFDSALKQIKLIDFSKWHNQFLNLKMRTFFSEYLEALSDGIISETERLSLQLQILERVKEVLMVLAHIKQIAR